MTTQETAGVAPPVRPPRRRLALAEQVLIGLALGIAAGVFFGEIVAPLHIVGDIFIKLLQITVIPYISLSLISGLGGLRYDEVKSLALKGGGILLVIWAITLVVVLLMPLAYPDWPSGSFFSTSLVDEPATPDFLRLFVPSNPFFSYANAIVPAVVVFCILVGVALIGLEKKSAVLEPLTVLRDAFMRITGMVAKLTPIGVFALMASTVGNTDIEDLARLQVHVVLQALIALILGLWVLPALITVVTPFRYGQIMRTLRTPLITAFATGSSLVVLPMLIERSKRMIEEAGSLSRADEEDAETSVDVLIPTSFTFPSPGGILVLSFVLFSGWYVGSDIAVASYPVLIAAGLPSLFGGSALTVPFLLDLFRLPIDLFQVFVSVDVIGSRPGTLAAAMHYAAIGLIGGTAMVGRLKLYWKALARFALVSLALIAVALIGVRAFYTYVVVAPYTKDDVLRSLTLLVEPRHEVTVHAEVPPALLAASDGPADPAAIRQRGVLRACFQSNEYPSAFYNAANPPQLVGFDVEMAHRLAERIGLSIEFISTEGEEEAAQLLNAGVCDVYMRTLPVSAGMTEVFALTSPVYRSAVGVIVRDYRRRQFTTWQAIRDQGVSLRLAVEGSPEALRQMRRGLPEAELVPIFDMAELHDILGGGDTNIDAVVDMAEEGAAWTLLYPNHSLVVPRPTAFMPVAYAVAHGNISLRVALDAWLATEKASGTVDRLYRYWMLGGAAKTERPPRWSVIRDVLGWVD